MQGPRRARRARGLLGADASARAVPGGPGAGRAVSPRGLPGQRMALPEPSGGSWSQGSPDCRSRAAPCTTRWSRPQPLTTDTACSAATVAPPPRTTGSTSTSPTSEARAGLVRAGVAPSWAGGVRSKQPTGRERGGYLRPGADLEAPRAPAHARIDREHGWGSQQGRAERLVAHPPGPRDHADTPGPGRLSASLCRQRECSPCAPP